MPQTEMIQNALAGSRPKNADDQECDYDETDPELHDPRWNPAKNIL
jgi:hypothetical protein